MWHAATETITARIAALELEREALGVQQDHYADAMCDAGADEQAYDRAESGYRASAGRILRLRVRIEHLVNFRAEIQAVCERYDPDGCLDDAERAEPTHQRSYASVLY